MATHASAEKRHRQSLKRREQNRFARGTLRTAIKKVNHLVESGNGEQAQLAFCDAAKLIDKAAVHGLLHKNNARRKVSRLQKRINKSAISA